MKTLLRLVPLAALALLAACETPKSNPDGYGTRPVSQPHPNEN